MSSALCFERLYLETHHKPRYLNKQDCEKTLYQLSTAKNSCTGIALVCRMLWKAGRGGEDPFIRRVRVRNAVLQGPALGRERKSESLTREDIREDIRTQES